MSRLALPAAVLAALLACDPTTPPADTGTAAAMPCQSAFPATHEQPIQIDSYLWDGSEVYHVDFGCCDMFLEVYDLQCNYVCAPSGGFSGQGDLQCPDFYDEATHLGTVWTD